MPFSTCGVSRYHVLLRDFVPHSLVFPGALSYPKMAVRSTGAKLADIIASVHITLDALAQAQSSLARPGMRNTRETRSGHQRKEVKNAYCTLLDVERDLFTLKRQIDNEEDEDIPPNVWGLGAVRFRGIGRHLKLSHNMNEDGFVVGDQVIIKHEADNHGNYGRYGGVVGTTAQYLYIVLYSLVGISHYTVKKMSKYCVHAITDEEVSLDSGFSEEDDVDE